MHGRQINQLLHKTEIFSDLSEEILDQIAAIAIYKNLAKNELLITQNTVADSIFVIAKGTFSIYKNHVIENGTFQAQFNIKHAGDCVGELSFLDDRPRSANVKALDEHCSVIVIPNAELKKIAPVSFYQKLAKVLSRNVRDANEATIRNLQNQLVQSRKLAHLGQLITYTLLLMTFYIISLKVFVSIAATPYVSLFSGTVIISIFTIALLFMIKSMGYPLSKYGVTLNNWKGSVKESIFYTIIIIIIITVIKWIIIHTIPAFKSTPLINIHFMIAHATPGSSKFFFWVISSMIIYAVFVNFQEFIARGVLQSCLQDFLQQKHKKLIANFVSSGVFSAMHVHLSYLLPLAVFLPSLFWGWLYIRQRTLIGPIISHIMIGVWAIWVLGLDALIR